MDQGAKRASYRPLPRALCLAAPALLAPRPAWAHVKWFAEYTLGDPPAPLGAVLTPTLLALAVLSMTAVGVLAAVERRVADSGWYARVDRWLAARADQALLVLRVAMGATLLLSWQADAVLAPELPAEPWLGWWQFALAFLLLFRRGVPAAGVGLLALYGVAILRFGLFHMLDYLHYAGIGWYLAVAQLRAERVRETRIPALYLTVGFSLCWLALEKLVYPQWTEYLLAQNPQLALGIDPDFFRVGARWNSSGRSVIYAADSFAGSLLEILAHSFRPRALPGRHHAVRIEIPDELAVEGVDPAMLPDWDSPDSRAARERGDAWLDAGRTAVLVVPALPAHPIGRNLLINPSHPDARRIRVSEPFPVPWDERLF
jgi:RES domain-containing protein